MRSAHEHIIVNLNVIQPRPYLRQLQIKKKKKRPCHHLIRYVSFCSYFYNSDESRLYMMPDSLMVPGQVCACIFPEDQNWHRGVITGRNTEGFIQVCGSYWTSVLHVTKKVWFRPTAPIKGHQTLHTCSLSDIQCVLWRLDFFTFDRAKKIWHKSMLQLLAEYFATLSISNLNKSISSILMKTTDIITKTLVLVKSDKLYFK